MGVVGRPIETAPMETDALILDMGDTIDQLILHLLLLLCSCLMGVVGHPIEAAPLETINGPV
jgi:hypothetical protein